MDIHFDRETSNSKIQCLQPPLSIAETYRKQQCNCKVANGKLGLVKMQLTQYASITNYFN